MKSNFVEAGGENISRHVLFSQWDVLEICILNVLLAMDDVVLCPHMLQAVRK